jgi:hypothetical protein
MSPLFGVLELAAVYPVSQVGVYGSVVVFAFDYRVLASPVRFVVVGITAAGF